MTALLAAPTLDGLKDERQASPRNRPKARDFASPTAGPLPAPVPSCSSGRPVPDPSSPEDEPIDATTLGTLHIAVVGAGPAGSAAACLLAKRGARVTLLERGRFPRDKVCGDGCSPRCVEGFERLGVQDLPASPAAAPIDGFRLISPSGHVYADTFPADHFGGRAITIPRRVLDARLVEAAVDAGADLREGQHVEGVSVEPTGVTVHVRDGEPLKADLVLGCDGAPSVVRRSMGAPPFPHRHSAAGLRAYFEGVETDYPTRFTIFFDRELLPAYAWIFPLPDGRANVGLGMRTDLLKKKEGGLKTRFEALQRSLHVLPELRSARQVSKVMGHTLPLGSHAKDLVFDRTLLLGDAAGFINPLSGEGIEFAIDSALQATETIAEAAQAGDFSRTGLAAYAARCERSFRQPFDANSRLTMMFQFPWILDRMILLAKRSPVVQETFTNSFSGLKPEFLPLFKELTLGQLRLR